MLNFSSIRQPKVSRPLNQIVDELTRNLNVRRLERDLPRRDRTQICHDYLSMLRRSSAKLLVEDHHRQPYLCHVALAVHNSIHAHTKMTDLGSMLTMGTRHLGPEFSDGELKQLIEDFEVEPVQQTIRWIAREQFARSACFGTKGLHLRSYFLRVCAIQRWQLNSTHQPPDNYEPIVLGLLEAGVLQVVGYHRSRGVDYASLKLVGHGRMLPDRRDAFRNDK